MMIMMNTTSMPAVIITIETLTLRHKQSASQRGRQSPFTSQAATEVLDHLLQWHPAYGLAEDRTELCSNTLLSHPATPQSPPQKITY